MGKRRVQVVAAVAARGVALLVALAALSSCASPSLPDPATVLLYAGVGTSPGDVEALRSLVARHGLSYVSVAARQLDAMPEQQLEGYRLVMVPGGNFEQIGNGLKRETVARLRRAISAGTSYVGFCAGAFFAGASPYNGLDLTAGVRFPFYALESQGVRKGVVTITSGDSQTMDVYWEDGPQLSGWGQPIGRYPDGTPAVVEGQFGKGWVVLTGVHPEAPESWRSGLPFATSVEQGRAYAVMLIDAALTRHSLALR